MTEVHLVLNSGGELIGCDARGHSGFALKGSDIVCSAVSVLLRTAAQVLSETKGVEVSVDATERGILSFKVQKCKQDDLLQARLVCVADFIKSGMQSLMAEYPDNVKLVLQKGDLAYLL